MSSIPNIKKPGRKKTKSSFYRALRAPLVSVANHLTATFCQKSRLLPFVGCVADHSIVADVVIVVLARARIVDDPRPLDRISAVLARCRSSIGIASHHWLRLALRSDPGCRLIPCRHAAQCVSQTNLDIKVLRSNWDITINGGDPNFAHSLDS